MLAFPRLFALIVFSLLFLPVSLAGQLEILQIDNESTIPETVYSGDLVTLTFDVKNISGVGAAARDVKVSMELNENDFEPVKVSETISEVRSKGSKTISLRFKANESVLPGNYTVPVFLEYLNGSDMITQTEDVDFTVSACQVIRIQNIRLTSSHPHIGDEFGISADLKNPCSTAIRDVSVELKPVTNATIDPFVVSSGTVKKIGDVQPGESETVDFSMNVSDKVSAKTYVFALDANCSDCAKTFSNSFSFLVLGEPELVFSNIEYSVNNALGGSDKQIFQGSTFTLSVQIDNIGEEKAKAVEVSVDFGDSVVGVSKSFLGNVDPDDSGAAIFDLQAGYLAQPGENPGVITVSYVDELGDKREIKESYSLYINEQPPVSPLVYIFILVLVIVALAIIYFIVKFVFRQLAIRKAQSR